jgi:acetolactate synthase I/II/III large subunit
MKVVEYIARLLLENGINTVFSVVGGGAMHLNDAFGNCDGLRCIYNHHEQASAIAAEGYARVNNNLAVTCVTSGPGGTNAITGVLCAWQDNIPMLVISGQVRYETMVESTGLKLRQFGEQEHYIVDTVKSITKYAVTIRDADTVRYHIERAVYEASHGRRGPCWIDIPLNIQGAQIDPEKLAGFEEPPTPEVPDIRILEKVFATAKRPVILAGSAIRTANVYDKFKLMIKRLGIPVIAATANADLFPAGDKNYFGNFGIIGGRAGNFIVQNADCILGLGCRLSFKQIGFYYQSFSPNSIKIVVDVDADELKKPTIKVDYPINTDLGLFIDSMEQKGLSFGDTDHRWLNYCLELKREFPIFREEFKPSEYVNPYFFAKELKNYLPEDSITVVGNSCACDIVRQCGIKYERQRLWGNTNCGTMGYDLPAAIGAAAASKRTVICVTGDGSIQMNLQELQTIVHNKLPVKIFIHSNGGYFAIVQTHTNYFGRLSGCTEESGLSIPDFEKLSYAYGIPYWRCATNNELREMLPEVLAEPGYGICEIISDTGQLIEPKTKSKVLPEGQIFSPPIDDLYPFLNKDTYEKYANFDNFVKEKAK